MKNRIIGVLLAALMLVSILPFAALSVFAGEEDLIITKNGAPAVAYEDYEWFNGILNIYEDGLTVSGEIDDGRIRCMASDLTFDNFSITFSDDDDDTVAFHDDCVLYLKGNNFIFNENGSFSGIYSYAGSFEIAGDGNLDVYSAHDGIYAEGRLTVSASGKINVDVAHGAVICWAPIFRETVNMFFAHGKGEDCGVLWSWECAVIDGGLGVKGSADYVDSIGLVTDDFLYDEDSAYYYVGEGDNAPIAKSLLIISSEYAVLSLGAKVNEKTSSLRLGARYNGFLLGAAERASVEDLGMLFYPSHLLGTSALDLGNASAARMSATAIEEFDAAKKFVDYDSFTFYVTIVNIPDKGKDTNISFRPYIIYSKIYSKKTVYGDVYERSYYSVLDAAGVLAYKQGDNEISCPDNWFD